MKAGLYPVTIFILPRRNLQATAHRYIKDLPITSILDLDAVYLHYIYIYMTYIYIYTYILYYSIIFNIHTVRMYKKKTVYNAWMDKWMNRWMDGWMESYEGREFHN